MKSKKSSPFLKFLFASAVLISFGIVSCGDGNTQDPSKFGNTKKVDGSGDISTFELENGIGPVKQKIEFTTIDSKLVKQGQAIFETKCASCHKLDERYVGPAQRDVWKRRSPEYILNMMLNPEEMYKRHPEAKKLLAEYMTPMPAQNLNMDDARSLLEYFRKVAEEK